ncbi:hypothetical protein TrST_g846 [Triparma strigata]|uniref:Uncharacterized protein n=1 Tax=Triparma strigata TaxID=1606541 RepID=A0A9W7EPK8_9STRA|nr:hypothetical protein TrST_g846 [Triparma strigata]
MSLELAETPVVPGSKPPDKNGVSTGTEDAVKAIQTLVSEFVESVITPLPTENPPNPPNGEVVECAWIWAILCFFVSSVHTGIMVAYALSGKEIYNEYYWLLSLPTCCAAMAISFFLKPRRTDLGYRAFLFAQYFILTACQHVAYMIGSGWGLRRAILRTPIWVGEVALLVLALRVRLEVAKLSDTDLSSFLSLTVLKGGVLVGLGQLVFLAFSAIQCLSEAKVEASADLDPDVELWHLCRRTLWSQTFLGAMICIVVVSRLVSGMFPHKYVAKHVPRIEKIAAMDLNLEEGVTALALFLSIISGLFFLSFYGVEGNFYSGNEMQQTCFIVFFSLGSSSLLISAVWKLKVIRRDCLRGERRESAEENQGPRDVRELKRVIELHWIWPCLAVIMTTLYSSSIIFALTIVRDTSKKVVQTYKVLKLVTTSFTPIVVVLFMLCLVGKPRKQGRYMKFGLYLHFFSFAIIVIATLTVEYFIIYNGKLIYIFMCIVLSILLTILFRYALKFRAYIGELRDEDLHDFLVRVLFGGGFQTLFTSLFVEFRSLKCIYEDLGVENGECQANTTGALYISMYLIIWWVVQMVDESLPPEWRNQKLTIQKIAMMKLSLRRGLEGVMLAFMAGCGVFLFALLGTRGSSSDTVLGVGCCGLIAGILCLISELYTTTKVRTRRLTASAPPAAAPEEVVEGFSWWYFALSALCSTTLLTLCILQAFNYESSHLTGRQIEALGYFMLPVVMLGMVMSVFFRPRDNGVAIKVLYGQLLTITVNEIAMVIWNFENGFVLSGWFTLALSLLTCAAFWLVLKLRALAAQRTPAELSELLCFVLKSIAGGAASILYFTFEGVSCYAQDEDGLNQLGEGYECRNSQIGAVYLSCYVAIMTASSAVRKVVPSEERETVLTYEILAVMRLKWFQQLQGLMATLTILASMFLFSSLGVKGKFSFKYSTIGYIGLITTGMYFLIDILTLVSERRGRPAAAGQNPRMSAIASERRLNITKLSGDLISLV